MISSKWYCLLYLLASLYSVGYVVRNDDKARDLEKLVAIGSRHGLPTAPKEARLVLAHTGRWRIVTVGNGSDIDDAAFYSPAFLLEERVDGSIVILRGLERKTLKPFRIDEPLWRKFSPDRVAPKAGSYATDFSSPSTFVCAVQLATRGDLNDAKALMQLFGEDDPEWGKQPTHLLANCIANHLKLSLLQGPEKWPKIRAQMQTLFDDFKSLNDGEARELLDDLIATLRSKGPLAGSVEAKLLSYAGIPHPESLGSSNAIDENSKGVKSAPARQIVIQGFKSVPDLISRLDDRRVTAHEDYPGDIKRVRDLADELLWEIAGKVDESTPKQRSISEWRRWWEVARLSEERDYFTNAIFQTNKGRIVGVNDTVATILAHKFPSALESICKTFSKHAVPGVSLLALSEAVAAAQLSKDERVRVLSDCFSHGSDVQQLEVLTSLAKVDVERCSQLIVQIMKKLPSKVEMGPNRLHYDLRVGQVILCLEVDKVWREYLRIAKLSNVGVKLEIIASMGSGFHSKKNLGRRLAVLSAFLQDSEVRDSAFDPMRFDRWCAAYEFPRIAVQDYAAMEIASILNLPDVPKSTWGNAEWSKLREKVRTKLVDENVPDFTQKK
jgi:hypothetical protein